MKLKKWICLMIALLLIASMLPQPEAQAYAKESATLTFSGSGVTETAAGAGYSISGTTLTISAAGTYRVTGSCAEGSIVVSKGLSGVTLILDDLTLTSAVTAPIVVKKESSVLLKLEGESTLTDDEDASTEETNADFEGACIKVKSGSSLTVFGDGKLNLAGNAKNGMKGAALSSLTVDGGTIAVNAANNAIAFDGSVTVNAGTLDLTAVGDGLKADPDETDTESAGTVTIHGGSIKVRAQSDGIQAKTDLTVTGGDFDIQTLNGYQSTYNENTTSCKGLKASGSDSEDSEDVSCAIHISGGTFKLNTADDAIHSDGDVEITFGTFEIYTGDDGVHANNTLTLGTENGYERDPEITVKSSYEGLEGSKINAWSGKYYIIASDDGMNSAGGSSNGSDPGGGWGPGGGGFPGGGGWGGPGGGGPGGGFPGGGGSSSGDYSMNFYGGSFYVDCKGDGLDSNGPLNLYGGDFTVLSMQANGDNSPLDSDGTMIVKGATVFGAGSAGMNERPSGDSQKYYTDSTRRNAGTVVNVSYNGSVVRSERLVRNISYLFYSSPEMTSTSCTVATASEVSKHQSNAFAHDWDDGTVETPATADAPGVMVYTCSCGAVERKTIDQIYTPTAYEEEGETDPPVTPMGYTANFQLDGHAQIDVYYRQDYAAPNETGVSTAVSRSSATGEPDSTGDGQINFAVRLEDGYELDGIEISGNYKNLKGPADTGVDNVYRITKIAGNLTVTVKTKKTAPSTCEHDYQPSVTQPTCTAQGYTTWTCAKCGDSYVDSYTAKIAHNYQDGVCAVCGEKLLTVTISCGEGASVTVLETQKPDGPKVENATQANPRDSESGLIDCSGEGQVNFIVNVADGYALESVTAEPAAVYKNLKGPADTGIENGYRITKIKGDFAVTVKVNRVCEHDYQAETTAPTCTEKGYTTYTCTKCGDSYTGDETDALGHDYKAVVTEPTCTAKGFTTYTCSRCGDSYTGDETDALGHDWDEGKITVEPTETTPGERIYTCKRCRETKTAYVPELNHTHDFQAVVTAPTCTEKGYTTYTCICGESYTADEVDKLGHDFADGVCTRCGAADPDYVPPVDKTGLDRAVNAAEALKEADYTPESYAPLAVALTDAKAVRARDDATQAEVDAAAAAVNEAIAGLKSVKGRADKKELAQALADADAVEKDKYTEHSVQALEAAAEAARAVNDRDDAAQAEVDKAAADLNAAIDALEEKPADEFRFDDVLDPAKFYYEPVYWAYNANPQITNGITATLFGPDNGCTRGQVVTFLWRAAGCPEPQSLETGFTDLKEGGFYVKAVAWAVENGITKGTSATTFDPDATCTRGQIVTFLWRFRGEPAPKDTETKFTDVVASAFYAEAVAWAVEEDVTKGMTATTFGPKDTCTRGQIVTFLFRAMKE